MAMSAGPLELQRHLVLCWERKLSFGHVFPLVRDTCIAAYLSTVQTISTYREDNVDKLL